MYHICDRLVILDFLVEVATFKTCTGRLAINWQTYNLFSIIFIKLPAKYLHEML